MDASAPPPGRVGIRRAEVRLSSRSVAEDLPFFTRTLGFRLDEIFPADAPAVIALSGHGLHLRIEEGRDAPPGALRLLCDDPAGVAAGLGGATRLTAPGGTEIELVTAEPDLAVPPVRHAFSVRRLADGAPWVIGRAGMHYRDLVPDRLGGSIIASHIRIPDGGPVPDMVHYHVVGFQLIHCYRGWVDVVYEDQGDPIRLHAGDCVTQPPRIRHRVLEASDEVEVIEIGVPAEHVTAIDHEMTLPTGRRLPERTFGGQTFVHHEAAYAAWTPWRLAGFEARDTGVAAGTAGMAGVQVVRPAPGDAPGGMSRHDADILFAFVMEGAVTLEAEDGPRHALEAGDAFTVPPGLATRLTEQSAGLELLEVSLPGRFETRSA